MVQVLATAASAFAATNLDDLLLLLLFFSAAAGRRDAWQLVAGQYLGFSILVAASLVGYLGSQYFPGAWIGLLGLLPMALGVSQWIDTISDNDQPADVSDPMAMPAWLSRWSLPSGQLL